MANFTKSLDFNSLRRWCWHQTHLPLYEAYLKPALQLRQKFWQNLQAGGVFGDQGFCPVVALDPRVSKLLEDQSETNEIRYFSYFDQEYPTLLRKIPYAPWGLFVKGRWPSAYDFQASLAIVGTRKPNPYGRSVVKQILGSINTEGPSLIPASACKLTVSGMAYGIDGCAHEVSLEHGIATLGVLAHGLKVAVHPSSHQDLAQRILINHGCLTSEFPLEMPAYKNHFPWRNRIIAGLAPVLWVVQGTKKSGTRHTVRHALDQGKTIGVTPGDIFSDLSQIAHEFLREGAHPITQAQDLRELLMQSRRH